MGAGERTTTIVLLVDGASEVVARLPDLHGRGLVLVDALARVQLSAKRLGYGICVPDPCPELARLLELVGLADVLRCGGPCSVDEAGRQPEGGEQLGLQEVVEATDPAP